MGNARTSLRAMINKTKICHFERLYALGGYCFTYVSLCERDDLDTHKYYFEADAIYVDLDGKFVSGAILTYSPHKTLSEAMERWQEFGSSNQESEDGSGIEQLAKRAITAYRKGKTF